MKKKIILSLFMIILISVPFFTKKQRIELSYGTHGKVPMMFKPIDLPTRIRYTFPLLPKKSLKELFKEETLEGRHFVVFTKSLFIETIHTESIDGKVLDFRDLKN